MNEPLSEKLSWSALEYENKEHSKDWFWALCIIIVTSTVASIIFGDYFFAALLIISGVLLGFFAVRKPETVFYELNNKGLKIGSRIYLYENIKSFWVQVEQPEPIKNKSLLFIHSERIFMPIITIPIKETIAEEIHYILSSKNILEVKMKEHPSDQIMEILGF